MRVSIANKTILVKSILSPVLRARLTTSNDTIPIDDLRIDYDIMKKIAKNERFTTLQTTFEYIYACHKLYIIPNRNLYVKLKKSVTDQRFKNLMKYACKLYEEEHKYNYIPCMLIFLFGEYNINSSSYPELLTIIPMCAQELHKLPKNLLLIFLWQVIQNNAFGITSVRHYLDFVEKDLELNARAYDRFKKCRFSFIINLGIDVLIDYPNIYMMWGN